MSDAYMRSPLKNKRVESPTGPDPLGCLDIRGLQSPNPQGIAKLEPWTYAPNLAMDRKALYIHCFERSIEVCNNLSFVAVLLIHVYFHDKRSNNVHTLRKACIHSDVDAGDIVVSLLK